jgi:hypothetical protein
MPEDRGLKALLGCIGRETPPQIPVEALLARATARAAWRLGVTGALAAGVLLLALLLFRKEPEPPVHLRIQVIDVPAILVRADATAEPLELDLP